MKKRALALLLPAFVLMACSALFEDAEQCKTDADCSKYGAVCTNGVCTKGTSAEGGLREGGSDTDAPNGVDTGADVEAPPDPCDVPDKPVVDLAGDVTADLDLACTSIYMLRSRVIVRAGATLTIDSGTKLLADPGTSLVIQMGAKIMANGTKDKPVVMTSSSAAPTPGDWLGLYVLGDAPNSANQYYADPDLLYGGANADSNSGSLTFLRVEYGLYGLATGGVGRATKIDSVMARLTMDNCFTAFGGTADFKHLICQFPGDEMFEGNDGWGGRLQFFYGSKTPAGDEHHGFLLDSSSTTINNVTLCGENVGQSYGLVIRNGSKVDLGNMIITGWFGGADTRGPVMLPGTEIANSIFFGNAGNPAYPEGSSGDPNSYLYDDDNGFNEIDWFEKPSRVDMEIDPQLVACTDVAAPKPYPPAVIAGRAPAADGFFDPAAAYVGAFADPNDAWATGAWVKFGAK